jgi:hypothetical protein
MIVQPRPRHQLCDKVAPLHGLPLGPRPRARVGSNYTADNWILGSQRDDPLAVNHRRFRKIPGIVIAAVVSSIASRAALPQTTLPEHPINSVREIRAALRRCWAPPQTRNFQIQAYLIHWFRLLVARRELPQLPFPERLRHCPESPTRQRHQPRDCYPPLPGSHAQIATICLVCQGCSRKNQPAGS